MNMMPQWLVRAGVALLAAALCGCAGTPNSLVPPSVASQAMAVDDYLIGVDDLVAVRVWRHPDLDVTVPVRSDGRISVPLIGDIAAGGRAPQQVADAIAKALASYIRDPQVAVILTELRSHEYLSRVRVTGAVRTPVSIPYRQGMTVLDLVLAAGGPTEFAAKDRASLHRREHDKSERYGVPLTALLERGDLSHNYPLQPGDVITVPERAF